MISHVVLKSRSRSILESILWWLKMLEIFDHLLNYRILYTQQYCNCSTDKCCEAYGCMPSPDPGPLYFVCWPWELLWQRIVWCILFPTKHHTHASAMFSDTNNTYVVTPYLLVCYICYNSWLDLVLTNRLTDHRDEKGYKKKQPNWQWREVIYY